jgi:hypothetical protein
MEIIQALLPPAGTIVDSGDYHLGAMNCRQNTLLEMIERVRSDPNCFLINKGDSIEAILPNDKRFAFCGRDKELPTPAAQRDWLIDAFRPIRDRILAWGMGNHEFKLINTLDIGREIATALGIEYGGYTFVVSVVDDVGKSRFKMLCTHGNGSLPGNAKDPIQREGNRQAACKRKLENMGFKDCVYSSFGHTHQSCVVEPTISREVMLTTKGKKLHHTYRAHTRQDAEYIPPEARWYVNTPSFLSTFAPSGGIAYSEVAMFAPAEIGWVEIDYADYRITGVRKVNK